MKFKEYTKLVLLMTMTGSVVMPAQAQVQNNETMRFLPSGSALTPTQIERLSKSELNYLIILKSAFEKVSRDFEEKNSIGLETKIQLGTLALAGTLLVGPEIVSKLFGTPALYCGPGDGCMEFLYVSFPTLAGLPIATKLIEARSKTLNEDYLSHYDKLIELVNQNTTNENFSEEQRQKLVKLEASLKASKSKMSDATTLVGTAQFLESVSIFVSIVGAGAAVSGAPIITILSIPVNTAIAATSVALRGTGEYLQASDHREIMKAALGNVNAMINSLTYESLPTKSY